MDKPRITGVIYFSMRLALEILDGNNKGKRLVLHNGLKIGRTSSELFFNDPEMKNLHIIAEFDLKKLWNIRCLDNSKIRLGFEEVNLATLIPGLVFHLGQTGFKVIERSPNLSASWKNDLITWLENFSSQAVPSNFFFFLKPIRLTFIQGPQYEEIFTLGYGPREIGYNNLDLSIKDPSTPLKVAKFYQIGDRSYVENLCGDAATINGAVFDQHIIYTGDILRVSSSTIELSILL